MLQQEKNDVLCKKQHFQRVPLLLLVAVQVLLMLLLSSGTTTTTSNAFLLDRYPDHFGHNRISLQKYHDDQKFQQQQKRTSSRCRSTTSSILYAFSSSTSLSDQQTVLVIGGTGGVGQLVSKKLRQKGYNVRVSCRDVERGIQTMNDSSIDVVPIDLTIGASTTTGSTTDTTSTSIQVLEQQLIQNAIQDDVTAVIISIGTTAFPTQKWIGGNTPDAIDNIAVTAIAKAISSTNNNRIHKQQQPIQKVVLVTSIGVNRTNVMPFQILNLFGVLNSKRLGEEAVQACGVPYVIVRPGRLIGGPFTNLDIAKLLQIDAGSGAGVTIEYGDTLLGDCQRDSCSEVIVQSLLSETCTNMEFSVVSNETIRMFQTQQEWDTEFGKVQQQKQHQQQLQQQVV